LSGRRIEVMNMGLPSAGPDNYLGVLHGPAAHLGVDTAVVVLAVGDDIEQAHPALATKLWFGSPQESLQRPYMIGFSSDYWYMTRLWRTHWRAAADLLLAETDATHASQTFLSVEHERLGVYARTPSAFVEQSYAAVNAFLKALRDEAVRDDIHLLVAIVPDQLQLRPDVQQQLVSTYHINLADYDLDQPNRRLTAMLQTLGVASVDLAPALRAQAQTAPVYYKNNMHWNELGNSVVSAQIWSALTTGNLLK
jgi:hypothetical protein